MTHGIAARVRRKIHGSSCHSSLSVSSRRVIFRTGLERLSHGSSRLPGFGFGTDGADSAKSSQSDVSDERVSQRQLVSRSVRSQRYESRTSTERQTRAASSVQLRAFVLSGSTYGSEQQR